MEEVSVLPPPKTVKVVLFGDPEAGKSSIIDVLLDHPFNEEYLPSTGNDSALTSLTSEYNCMVWSTMGDAGVGFKGIEETDFDALIFVVDGTKPHNEESARAWFNAAKEKASPNTRFYIAVAKSDQDTNINFSERKLVAIASAAGIQIDLRLVYNCSAVQNSGIPQLFEKVTEDYINKQPGLETREVQTPPLEVQMPREAQAPKKVSGEKESLGDWLARHLTLPNVLIGGGVALGGVTAIALFTLAAFTAGSFLTFGILPSAFIGAAIITAAVVAGWAIGSAIMYRMSDAYKNQNKELHKPEDYSSFRTDVASIPEKKVDKTAGVEHTPPPVSQAKQPSSSFTSSTSSSSPSPQSSVQTDETNLPKSPGQTISK